MTELRPELGGGGRRGGVGGRACVGKWIAVPGSRLGHLEHHVALCKPRGFGLGLHRYCF